MRYVELRRPFVLFLEEAEVDETFPQGLVMVE